MIQKITCPSAESKGVSESWQAECFERLLNEIASSGQMRFTSVFTFQDFDEETCAIVRDALLGTELDSLPAYIAQRLTGYLCAVGVVDPTGVLRPVWPVIMKHLDTRSTQVKDSRFTTPAVRL